MTTNPHSPAFPNPEDGIAVPSLQRRIEDGLSGASPAPSAQQTSAKVVERIARTLAYEEWPHATLLERNAWTDKHWDDQKYIRFAKAIAALRTPAIPEPAQDRVQAAAASLRALVDQNVTIEFQARKALEAADSVESAQVRVTDEPNMKTVSRSVYESAVEGRQEFRSAFRREREKVHKLTEVLDRRPSVKSTAAMRERVRELATPPRDDFDRAVLSVLDDLEAVLAMPAVLEAALSPIEPASGEAGDVIAEIAAERCRQIEQEGWSAEHDDSHTDGSLARAAACYALEPPIYRTSMWPWAAEWWKPSTRRRDLVKAAALLVAEIERLDRTALLAAQKE